MVTQQNTATGIGWVPIPVGMLVVLVALFWASVQDIRTKEVSNLLHIVIALTAFAGFSLRQLPIMLIGAVVTALPLFIAAVIKQGSVGGADIKLMAACGLSLGAMKGLVALMIGLFLGVTITYIFRKIKKNDIASSFPLVPYLAVGVTIAYYL